MKSIVGLVLVILGVCVGIYVGFWLCFIGGIVGIINAIKAPEPITAGMIVWNVAKILLAGVAGWGSAFIFILPGMGLIKK